MKQIHAVLLCALCAAPPVSSARDYGYGSRGDSGGGFLDLSYVANDKDTFTSDSPIAGHTVASGSGNGFGIHGLVRAINGLALDGEYRAASHDFGGGSNEDADYARVGVGIATPTDSGVFVEWNKLKFSDNAGGGLSMDGWAIHGRLSGDVAPQVQIYGEAGYADMKDTDNAHWTGPDLTAGASFALTEQFALFADYRIMDLKATHNGSSAEDRFSGVNLGVRLSFGG